MSVERAGWPIVDVVDPAGSPVRAYTKNVLAEKGKADKIAEIEEEIDSLAAHVWKLSDTEMRAIKDSLLELVYQLLVMHLVCLHL